MTMPPGADLLLGDPDYEMWTVPQSPASVVKHLKPQLPIFGEHNGLGWCKQTVKLDNTRWVWGTQDDGLSINVYPDGFNHRSGITRVAVMTGSDGGMLAQDCAGGSNPAAAPPTVGATTTARPAPTDAEVKDAVQAFIDERTDSGVMLAQTVTSVNVADGVVTVTMDVDPTFLELSPFTNHAELFGVPVGSDNDEGAWLRQTVDRVDVVDVAGNSLGSLTAAQLHQNAVG